MKKIKFLLPLFVLFIALFTSCDSQMKEPEYTVHQDEWKIHESLWGKKFKLLTQESGVATEGALFGYLEITADGSDLKIIAQTEGSETGTSIFAPYEGLKELYDHYFNNGNVIQLTSNSSILLHFDAGDSTTNWDIYIYSETLPDEEFKNTLRYKQKVWDDDKKEWNTTEYHFKYEEITE